VCLKSACMCVFTFFVCVYVYVRMCPPASAVRVPVCMFAGMPVRACPLMCESVCVCVSGVLSFFSDAV
jgi:hypothetical protein